MTTSIRLGRPDDLDAALAVCLAAFEPIHAGFLEALGPVIFERQYGRWREGYAAFFTGFPLDDPLRRLHVAERGGRLVGFVTTTLDPDSGLGEIGLTAVDPAAQRRGVCRALLAAALADLKARGAGAACVGTGGDPGHAPARAAYAAAGFDRAIPSIHLFRSL